MTDIDETTREDAVEASTQGKFNFLDRLASRNYPSDKVEVYLDENAGYMLDKLTTEIESIETTLKIATDEDSVAAATSELEDKIAEREKLVAEMSNSKFTFCISGISTEAYDKIVTEAQLQFPLEYEKTRHPLTFAAERELIPNEMREIYFRTHLWAAFIDSVSDPDGNVDTDITPAWVARVLQMLPIAGQVKIGAAVNKLRMTTDWMDAIQGEDFFPKS